MEENEELPPRFANIILDSSECAMMARLGFLERATNTAWPEDVHAGAIIMSVGFDISNLLILHRDNPDLVQKLPEMLMEFAREIAAQYGEDPENDS